MKKWPYLLMFALPCAVFAQENVTTETDPFADGDVTLALLKVKEMPKGKDRNEKIAGGVEYLANYEEIKLDQVLQFMALMEGPLTEIEKTIFLDAFKLSATTHEDMMKLHSVFEKGIAGIGGSTPEGRASAAKFFKDGQMLDLQLLFFPDFYESFNAKKYNDAVQTLDASFERAQSSGREKDLLSVWKQIACVINDTAYTTPGNPLTAKVDRYIPQLVYRLPRVETTPLVDRILATPNKNAAFVQALLSETQQRMNRSAPQGVVDKLWWRDCYNTLKWVCEKASVNPPANLKTSLTNAARLWVTNTQRLIRDNEARMRNARNIYNRQKNSHAFMTSVDAQELMDMAPEKAWLDFYKSSNKMDVYLDIFANLCMLQDDYSKALSLILSGTQPMAEKINQANRLLAKMAESLNPNSQVNNNKTDRYGNSRDMAKSAIAITRLRQQENIRQFRGVLTQLDSAGIEIPFEQKLRAFESMHSPAEVYLYDDVVMALGEPSKLSFDKAMGLTNHLRGKLKVWSSDKTQSELQTRRTPKETEALTGIGYELMDKLLLEIEKGEAGRNPVLHAIHGITLYEEAAYLESKEAPETFVEKKRTQGLQCFQRAGDLYASRVQYLYESQYSIELYNLWLEAFLIVGTGKNAVKDRPNVEAIRESILKMPSDAAKKHLEQFANHMYSKMSEQGPYERRSYITTALRVIKGTRIEPRFKERLTYYNNLLSEAKLVVEVDQDQGRVSNAQVGIRLRLYYTPELSREAGGFSRYLRPADNPSHALAMTYGGVPTPTSIANREEVERKVRMCLEESFEVLSIAFADPKAAPRKEKDGYESIPVAYFLIRPKDPTVDQIPSVSFDLEFADHGDIVYLPTVAEACPIAFRPDAEQVPPANLDIVQRVNFRDLERGVGRATLEVLVTGDAMIGPWDSFMGDSSFVGFTVADFEDGQAQIKEVESENGEMKVSFERVWTFHLKPEDAKNIPLSFKFPACKAKANTRYLYTHDVNFKSCSDVCAVRSAEGVSENYEMFALTYPNLLRLIYIILGLGVVGGIFTFLWKMFRCRPESEKTHLSVPKKLTSFTVLHYLRSLDTPEMPLSDEERATLKADIASLEARYFAANAAPETEADLANLSQIFARWQRLG